MSSICRLTKMFLMEGAKELLMHKEKFAAKTHE